VVGVIGCKVDIDVNGLKVSMLHIKLTPIAWLHIVSIV